MVTAPHVAVVPSVRTRKKSAWNPGAVDFSIYMAMLAARNIPQPMAVFHEGEVIGMVRGCSSDRRVGFMPMTHKQWCGFSTYDVMDAAAKGGKYTQLVWSKTMSSWTFVNSWGDMWPCAGYPGAGAYTGTANTARQFDHTTAGGLWHRQLTPGALETKHLVEWSTHIIGGTTLIRQLILYDRVLAYDGTAISSSTTTLTNTLAAQRYISAGQDGLLVNITSSVGTGATASNLTGVTVTDQSGTTAVSLVLPFTHQWDTGSQAPSTTMPASMVVPTSFSSNSQVSPFLVLNGGMSGYRKVETFISSATNTGTITWAMCKPIATMWSQNQVSSRIALARSMFALERIYDTACLSFFFIQAASAAGDTGGHLGMVHA